MPKKMTVWCLRCRPANDDGSKKMQEVTATENTLPKKLCQFCHLPNLVLDSGKGKAQTDLRIGEVPNG